MFGDDGKLVLYLGGMGIAAALLSGLMAWAVARRYGSRMGWLVPILALVTPLVMIWRTMQVEDMDLSGYAPAAIAFVGPSFIGALIGLMIARRRGG